MSIFKKYTLYIQLQFNIPLSALLICQALVLAWKLDDSSNTYDWGIVFLPIWVYLLVQYAQSIYYSEWYKRILRGVCDSVVSTVCIYLISSRIYMHTERYICLYLCAYIHIRVSYIIIKINVYI